MPATGSTQLSAEVKALYDGDFYLAGQAQLYFDPLCDLKKQMGDQRGQTYNWPLVSSLQPQTSVLDELTDVTPQRLNASELSVQLYEHGGAIEVTKFVTAVSYADVYKQVAFANGYSLAESFDNIVRAVAGQGSRVWRQNARAARSDFAGQATAADRLTPAFIERMAVVFARSLRMPLYEDGSVCTVMHPFVFYDLLQNTSIRDMAIRQTPEFLFNGELAYWGGMRIVVSANAKAFWGAGAVATSSCTGTLSTAANPGDATLYVSSVTSLSVGNWIAIRDAGETGNTWSDTNELFQVTRVGTTGAGGTGIDGFALDPGPGVLGGLRYAHASGTAYNNSNSVYPIPVIGPNSITKVASELTGPYGETVITGPFDRLGRNLNFGWYAVVGFGRTLEGWLMRGEVGASES